MGSFLSSLLGGSPAYDSAASSEDSRVTSFHSSARWQLHFNSHKDSSQLLVIDFSASWCGPCRLIEPAVHYMSTQFTDVDFAKIDVDELSVSGTGIWSAGNADVCAVEEREGSGSSDRCQKG
ncbi:hypothetical protein PRUPE_3G272400 [Prunus persica]|uniref:Thioredoxin domain-containing protein n=1 Tax=Prunus persica TaxID=3760 RepID=A0A251Q691_PRUPE|nr:hypothetical protein PRUPE_3G272400 [Prunus persica]